MTDDLPKVRAHMKKLRDSQRKGIGRNGDRVEYRISSAEAEAEKFKQKPHDMYLGGANRGHPRVPRKE